MRSGVYLDSNCCRADNRHLVGVIGAEDESSLFSSSLSDLVHHKLMLSNKILSQQSSSVVPQNGDELEPYRSLEETEGQTINSLLPDEEDLFSGIADEMGPMGHANGGDDLEDFDLFFGNGGIELGDDHLQASQRIEGYPWVLHPSQPRSAHGLDYGSRTRIYSTQGLPNGSIVGDSSPHQSSLFNDYSSSVTMSSLGSDFSHVEASQAFCRMQQLDNRGIPNFHPCSPQVPLHDSVNGFRPCSWDSMSGIGDKFCSKVPEKLNLDVRQLGFSGHLMELNEGGYGYSPNEIQISQSMASKSNSCRHHYLRSLLAPNSPSFLNTNHAHHIERVPGSPGCPHHMMNLSSPRNQLQAGSAPLMKSSLWDRQQMYTSEFNELSGYQMGVIRSMGIPAFSPARPREISSRGNFEVSKNGGLNSPQQRSQMYHERNSMNSLPTSLGSPSERLRSKRNTYETNLSHADRKHYELNIDRILLGDDSRTTLMLKNIPNKYTSKMLLATIDEQHRGKYNFIYLPIDFKNKCNMGYAFINMIDPVQIVALHQTFEGRKWEKFNSEKVATLAYARIQGKAALIAHFQNSSLMNEDKRCRPILFLTDGPNAGDQEPFPMGPSYRTKSSRQQLTMNEDCE